VLKAAKSSGAAERRRVDLMNQMVQK
jgi:hypothetical protein